MRKKKVKKKILKILRLKYKDKIGIDEELNKLFPGVWEGECKIPTFMRIIYAKENLIDPKQYNRCMLLDRLSFLERINDRINGEIIGLTCAMDQMNISYDSREWQDLDNYKG